MTSSLQSWVFDHIYSTRHGFPPCGSGLKSNHNLVGYPYNRHATISPVGTSLLADWYCRTHIASQLCKTVDEFSILGACITPSGNVKVSHGEEVLRSITT